MSGGSWNYVFRTFEEVGERLLLCNQLSRRTLGSLVLRIAKALHDIEWVDSDDFGPGQEEKAIDLALGISRDTMMLEQSLADAKRVLADLQAAIAKAQGG